MEKKYVILGWKPISHTDVAVNDSFDGIMNNDNFLVFEYYTGLASDDTLNFRGVYTEIIHNVNKKECVQILCFITDLV